MMLINNDDVYPYCDNANTVTNVRWTVTGRTQTVRVHNQEQNIKLSIAISCSN